MDARADVVVVGGGIAGLSAAYHLKKLEPKRRVVLVERDVLGGAASSRSASIVRHHYSNPIMVEMAIRARERYATLGEELGFDVGWVSSNGYVFMVGPEHEAALRRNVAMHRELGVDTVVLTAREVRKHFPMVEPEGIAAAAWDRQAGYAQALAVVLGFAAAAARLGVEFRSGTLVEAIDTEGKKVRAVATSNGVIRTDTVVLAAGAWAAGVARSTGVTLPLEPMVLQLAAVETEVPYPHTYPTISSDPGHCYFRPMPGGQLLVGGGEEHVTEAPRPDAFHFRARPEFVQDVLAKLRLLVPAAGRARLITAWSGIDGVTPDYHPILGASPVTGLVLCCGLSLNGFKFGPMLGQLVAECVIHGHAVTMDVTPLGYRRFETGELMQSSYSKKVIG